MTTTQILQLPVEERLSLIQELWDSFDSTTKKEAIPQWHSAVLQSRKESVEENKATYLSLDELR